MATTPIHGLPLTDQTMAPDGPTQMDALANAIDGMLSTYSTSTPSHQDGLLWYNPTTLTLSISFGSTWITISKPPTFGGTALIGSYDPSKRIERLAARKISTCDSTGMTADTLMPTGTSAILCVTFGMNLVTGHTVLFRTDLSSTSNARFQLRSSDSPYAAMGGGTNYDFSHVLYFQQ